MKNAFALLVFLALTITVAAQEYVKQRLEKSPRHQEWVEIKNGERTVNSFITYPETKDKTPVVV